MVDIEKIVGAKAWQRLQKAGIKNLEQLRSLKPEQLMTLAGIGPIKAQRVYEAIKAPQKADMKKTYKALAFRTKFKDIGGAIVQTTKKPHEAIGKIEDIREGLTLATNVMRSIGNIGRETKIPELRYFRMPPVLYPLEERYTGEPPLQIMEIVISPEMDQTKVRSTVYNARTSRIIQDTNEYFPSGTPTETGQRLLYYIDDLIKRVDRISTHFDFIILDPSYNFLDQPLQDKYDSSIKATKLAIVTVGEKSFWNSAMILNRFAYNREFIDMMKRFDELNLYYEYDTYKERLKEEKAPSFEQFKQEVGDSYDFMKKIESEATSYTQIRKPGQPAAFGVIKGINENQFWDYQRTFKPEQYRITVMELPGSYRQWKEETIPTTIGPKTTTTDLTLLAGHVFQDDATIWIGTKPGQPIIIQSNKIPEIGLVIY